MTVGDCRFGPLVCTLLFLAGSATAYEIVHLPTAAPLEAGGGYVAPTQSAPCLMPGEREAIAAELRAARAALVARGVLPAMPARDRLVALSWPLVVPAAGLDDPGVHGISNFVDHDTSYPDRLDDFDCGARTYDLPSGYNHQGTDIFTWPFAWRRMDADEVEIRAGAPGVILAKHDGNFDRNCGFGGGNWNAVYIEHADGSVAWYGHMKNGSLTTVPVGGAVAAGDYLGVVGSSGNSTGPHLHLELYDGDGRLIDPYAGPCNDLNHVTWWAAQPPYYDSAINALRTHWTAPQFPACPQPEVTNERDQFHAGDRVYFAAYYRDQRAGQASAFDVLRPDGSTWQHWNHSMSAAFYAASYWYWSFLLPANAPGGQWTFRASFQGQTVERRFQVGDLTAVPGAIAVAPGVTLHQPQPNPFNPRVEIRYSLATPAIVAVTVHDLRGRLVTTLASGERDAGDHSVTWDAGDEASGVYVVRAASGGEVRFTRAVLAK